MVRKTFFILSIFAACLFTANAATVSGVLKENDSAGATIGGATVTLTPTGGGTAILDTTDNAGAFSFANVPGTAAAPVTYRITAAKAGYRAMTGFTRIVVNNATGTFTLDLFLIPTGTVGSYTVSGIVYDSVAGSALAAITGARVILSSTAIVGAGVRETVTTAAGGAFTFDSVAVGTYTLTVSAASHATQTANITITVRNVARNFKLLRTVTTSISGTITDSASGAGLAAEVYLLTTARPAVTIDSVKAGSDGTYAFNSVPSSAAGITYTVRASLTDYVTGSVSTTVTGTTAKAGVNIKLVKIAMASISGTVTDSTSAGIANLAGVSVTLRSGGATIDSVVTGSDGKYSFANVPSGVTYTIRAAATGFVTSNISIAITGTAAQTVNIRLVPVPTGNLIIVVDKRTDSSAISGASVTATNGTTVLSGTTGSNGAVTFASVVTGTYAITVTDAGYTAINSNTALVANRNDSVKVYMVAAAAGTKMLKGVVKDSASSALLQHVEVVLTIAGAGVGGGTLTLIDSTNASGAYSFDGIPVSRTTGTITATLTGYRTFTHAVTIGQPNTADTTAYNFVMMKLPTGVIPFVKLAAGSPEFSMAHMGVLHLSNIGNPGAIKVFGLNGALVYETAIHANETSVSLPATLAKSGSALIVRLTQKSAVYTRQIMMP